MKDWAEMWTAPSPDGGLPGTSGGTGGSYPSYAGGLAWGLGWQCQGTWRVWVGALDRVPGDRAAPQHRLPEGSVCECLWKCPQCPSNTGGLPGAESCSAPAEGVHQLFSPCALSLWMEALFQAPRCPPVCFYFLSLLGAGFHHQHCYNLNHSHDPGTEKL